MTRTSDTSDDNILLAGSSIPGVMSELNLFLTKVRHPATENALDAYQSGFGPAEDVAQALEQLSYAGCHRLGEYAIDSSAEVHLVAYGPASVVQLAADLAAKFRHELINQIP